MSTWSAFTAFVEAVQEARDGLQLRSHQECFYRGHNDTNHQLLPSLFRKRDRTPEQYWKLERRAFFEFQVRARQLYETENSGWDVLFHMQHHGVPTRLLDWTSTFGVALYFALLNYQEAAPQPPCIWVMNPYALNHEVWGWYRLFNPKYLVRNEDSNRSWDYSELLLDSHPVGWKTPVAIYPLQRSQRMFAQNGWFTIHGTDLRSLQEMFPDRPDILRKIEIPKAAVPAGEQFLALAGIGHRQLFPELDGVARSVCERFGFGR
jgi:hypothetical protein